MSVEDSSFSSGLSCFYHIRWKKKYTFGEIASRFAANWVKKKPERNK